MTDFDDPPSDEDLEALAAASTGRAGASAASPSESVSATLADVLAAAERARLASERSGIVPLTDEQERQLRLKPVSDSLPAGARTATRAELEARIHPRILRAVAAWHWGSGNLVLMGRTGAGKTSGAAHLVRRLCAQAARHGGEAFELCQLIRWQSCRVLSDAGREAKLGTGTVDAIARCQNARLLILNDMGMADDRRTLERVLDERNERGWPTITTTGMRARGPESLEALLGDALSRRLFECRGDKGTFVEVWPDAVALGGKAR